MEMNGIHTEMDGITKEMMKYQRNNIIPQEISRFVKEIALHKGDLRKFTTKSTIKSLKEIYA